MAAEIEQLKSTIVELDGDNANIKCVLDIKQNEWTKVDTKAKKSTRNMNTNKIPLKANTFQTLDVEESNPRNGYNYKEASQTKTTLKGSPTHHRNRKESNMDPRNTADTNKRHNQEKQEKAVLVIGEQSLMTKQRSRSMTPSSCMLERTTWYMKNQRKLQLTTWTT